jgi:hypothetical protein
MGNSYQSIGIGGWPDIATEQILGRSADSGYGQVSDSGLNQIVQAIQDGAAIIVGTTSTAGASSGLGLVSNHAYAVTGYDATTQRFQLANPWGTRNPQSLSWDQLKQNIDCWTVASRQATSLATAPKGTSVGTGNTALVAAFASLGSDAVTPKAKASLRFDRMG